MKNVIFIGVAIFYLLTGCSATVPMATNEEAKRVQQLNEPSPGMAGIYVYRGDKFVGRGITRDVWINNECIGAIAPETFLYHEVEGDKENEIVTESKSGYNKLVLLTKKGMLYFIEQYVKVGFFTAGANLKIIHEAVGKGLVSQYGLAQKGNCDNSPPSEE